MKKTMLILSLLLMVALVSAIDFEISGEDRVRAALANDTAEEDGGWVDNRLNLGFDAQLHPDLALRLAVEIGNTVWGAGGGGITTGESIHVTEAFLSYRIPSIDANISVGQLYWMDKMGLIMDDYFSGVLLKKDDLAGMNTEFAWMKAREGNAFQDDDYNVFMAHANYAELLPVGVYAFFGNDASADYSNLTVYPYISMEAENMVLDMAAFLDLQMGNDTEIGIGGAVKGSIDLDVIELGLDALIAMENGLTTISPWYQNGLYIYGIGKHHDGAQLYWDTPYEANGDTFMSLVGNVKAPLNEQIKAFAAAGMLTDRGIEVNAGIEYELIPDLFHMAAYGAFGIHDDDNSVYSENSNYLFGTTLKIQF